MSNRRKIRETVLQAFYAAQVGDNPPEQVIQRIIKHEIVDDPAGLDFAERLFLRAMDHSEQTEGIIRQHIANWELDRLATLDRLILQLAITELIAFDDIPAKVTMNEAIEIAKKFSTAKSSRFVNGILDAALLTLEDENRLRKQGRGLIDQPARKSKSKKNRLQDDYIPDDVPDASVDPDLDVTPFTRSDTASDTTLDSGGESGTGSAMDPPRQKKKRIKRR